MATDEHTSLEPLFGKAALDRLGISRRQAAKRAHMSDTRWGQIAAGYEYKGGHAIPSRGPAGAVARMAAAIGVTAEQLRAHGRADAADALELMDSADERVLLREATDEQILAEQLRRVRERTA